MLDVIKRESKKRQELIKYLIIGLSGAALDFVLFIILFNLLDIPAVTANILSTSVGIINNFFLNAHYNFKRQDKFLFRFLSFYTVGLIGIAISSLLIRVFHDLLGFDANLIKAGSIIVVVIVQFYLNKNVSFRSFSTDKKISLYLHLFWKKYWFETILLIAGIGVIALIGPYVIHGDEYDNMLGGKLFWQGQLPYVDYFSHHMPMSYFLAAILYIFSEDSAFRMRIGFTTLFFGWTFINYLLLKHAVGSRIVALYLPIMGAIAVSYSMHMLLAENLVLLSLTSAFILISWRERFKFIQTWRGKLLIGILLAFSLLSSLSFAFITLLFILVAWMQLLPDLQKMRYKKFVVNSLLLGAPLFLFGIYLISTGSVSSFIFDNLTFNSDYYAVFTHGFSDTIPGLFIESIKVNLTSLLQVFVSVPHWYSPIYRLFIIASMLAGIVFLFIRKRYAGTILLIGFILIANTRVDDIGGLDFHISPIGSIAALSFAYVVYEILKGGLPNKYKVLFAVPVLLWAGIVCAIGVKPLVNIYNHPTSREQLSIKNEYRYHVIRANYIDSLNPEGEKVWLGPFDFATQMYMKSPRATQYTFYLPWHAKCDKCADEFINQLTNDRPKIIYWDRTPLDWGAVHRPSEYAGKFEEFLSENYYQDLTKPYGSLIFIRK